jgi:putative copper resistance protein D
MGVILIKDVHTLVSTGYGRGLLLKLMLVGSLLLLAASNKWLTVPHLHQEGFRNRLSRAIVLEMVLASLIFLVTGIITTIIGIE